MENCLTQLSWEASLMEGWCGLCERGEYIGERCDVGNISMRILTVLSTKESQSIKIFKSTDWRNKLMMNVCSRVGLSYPSKK